MRRDDRIRRSEMDEADEVRFGPRRPNGRWRSGWLLIACGVVLAAVVAVVVIPVEEAEDTQAADIVDTTRTRSAS